LQLGKSELFRQQLKTYLGVLELVPQPLQRVRHDFCAIER